MIITITVAVEVSRSQTADDLMEALGRVVEGALLLFPTPSSVTVSRPIPLDTSPLKREEARVC